MIRPTVTQAEIRRANSFFSWGGSLFGEPFGEEQKMRESGTDTCRMSGSMNARSRITWKVNYVRKHCRFRGGDWRWETVRKSVILWPEIRQYLSPLSFIISDMGHSNGKHEHWYHKTWSSLKLTHKGYWVITVIRYKTSTEIIAEWVM